MNFLICLQFKTMTTKNGHVFIISGNDLVFSGESEFTGNLCYIYSEVKK